MSENGNPPNPPQPANDAAPPGETPKTEAPNADAPGHGPDSASADAGAAPDAAAIALAERVNELEAEAQALKDERLRALAEAENARRRAQRDREEASRYGAAGLARDVVGVADNLTRALAAMPEAAGDGALAQLVEGVAMVQKELAGALEKHGVTAVGEVGMPFDHNTCQAVFEVETADAPPGAVAQVMQKGYLLHDRLLRPAMVGVAKAPANASPAPGGVPDGGAADRGGHVDETA